MQSLLFTSNISCKGTKIAIVLKKTPFLTFDIACNLMTLMIMIQGWGHSEECAERGECAKCYNSPQVSSKYYQVSAELQVLPGEFELYGCKALPGECRVTSVTR